MTQHRISQLPGLIDHDVTLCGWVANSRESKGIVFLLLRDGSGFCQVVISQDVVGEEAYQQARKSGLESSIRLQGKVAKDDRQVGGVEVQATSFELYAAAEDYPIAKKEHGVDFLMDHRHLWLRSRRQWAIMRVRNAVIMAIHQFFQNKGFIQMDAPLFTGNACEGTSTLFETDFYGDPAYLSQSGQLYGEAMAMAHGLIYTFGPTFRAEKSKTRRHLSEFWMIEPEMAWYDLDMDMDLIEDFLRFVVEAVLQRCPQELEVLERDTTALQAVSKPFPRLTYDEAVDILHGKREVNGQHALDVLQSDLEAIQAQITANEEDIREREAAIAAGGMKKGAVNFNRNKIDQLVKETKELQEKAQNIPQWIESARNFKRGDDFGGSDETILTRLFDTPVMVYSWPEAIKAFYMKQDPDRPGYVKGVDVLAPEGFGEIVGGGERETDHQRLVDQIGIHDLPMEAFEWYLDLRRFGSVPHSGFGLGLERLVAWVCNLRHVRETIPFPRMYGRLLP